MKIAFQCTLLLSLLLSGASAVAQESSQDVIDETEKANQEDEDTLKSPIIVIGDKEAEERVSEYIDSFIAVPSLGRFQGQYARIGGPICPGIYGFSADINQAIAKRIIAVGEASEIRIADQDCKTNVFVVAVDKGQDAVKFLRKKHSAIFGSLPLYLRDRMAKLEGPIFRWQSRTPLSSSNSATIDIRSAEQLPENPIFNASRIASPVIFDISASFILIEKKALVGLSATQIADFAAITSLMEVTTINRDKQRQDSILTLFDDLKEGRDPPQSVSNWDLVMLHAWYKVSRNRFATQQESALRQIVKKDVKASTEP